MQVLQTAAVHDSGEGSSSEPYVASQPVLGPAFEAEDFYTRLLRLQKGVDAVKHVLQQRGHNLANTQDIYGRTFKLPVDLDHKAIVFNGYTLAGTANPHQRGFWAATFAFFSTFFSTFAAAPLMVYIKKEEALGLSRSEIESSNIASVASNIGMRLVAGWLCEKIGPRRAYVTLLLVAVPGIVGITFTFSATGFIICRFVIGLGLATFVTCQVWVSHLYNKKVVGAANATAAGWGNLGGGITNLLMPYVMLGFLAATDDNVDLSWRLCYVLPLAVQLGAVFVVLSGRDLPDGNFHELEMDGLKKRAISRIVIHVGVSNINAWILTVSYGFCFGVELTVTSVAALYFFEYHGVSPQQAGTLASLFGLMNLFARSLGGLLSDFAFDKFGLRGRLWAMWVVQLLEGLLCLVTGWVTVFYESPDSGLAKVVAQFDHDGGRYTLLPSDSKYLITGCATDDIDAPKRFVAFNTTSPVIEEGTNGYDLPSRILIGDMDNADCIRQHDELLGQVVLAMLAFSICVQMAEGLHFAVVPYVSKPAMGIVMGMVAAGGNLGAVVLLLTVFRNDNIERTDTGFMVLGGIIMAGSLILLFLYFPEHGGMLFRAGTLSYNPQRVKVPAGYRGASAMDYTFHRRQKMTEDKVYAT